MSTIKPIFLLADSQLLFFREEGEPFLVRAVEACEEGDVGRPLKAAYLGASNGDAPEFYDLFVAAMGEVGIRDTRMIPSDPSPEDRVFLDKADLILLAGGDVERGWDVFDRTGLRELIVSRYYAGALLIGISAGAVQLGLKGWNEQEKLFDTFRLVPFVIDVHDEPGWARLGQIVPKAGEHARGFGIPSGGGAIYHADYSVEPVRHALVEMSLSEEGVRQALLFPGEVAEATEQERGTFSPEVQELLNQTPQLMKLYALADLHLRYEVTRRALEALRPHPYDWLILAGDVGETEEHLRFALALLTRRFGRLLWVPGNHDLWTIPTKPDDTRGEAKYLRMVQICRDYGVLTPEDPYVVWPGEGPRCILAPTFVLYDYTFRPDEIPVEKAIEWAAEENLLCSDEVLLHPDPYPSKPAWCAARVRETEPKLAEAAARAPLVIINHFPLRRDLAILPAIPRFSIWCGTRLTEDWHLRFRAEVVIHGHLHIRGRYQRDGVRFEEVSLGYPPNWDQSLGVEPYLRQILPHPAPDDKPSPPLHRRPTVYQPQG